MIKEKLNEGISNLNINCDSILQDKMLKYVNLLMKYNKNVNLTALKTEIDIIEKHFLDSLILKQFIPDNSKCIDIGTGAGFPGLALAIMDKTSKYDLVESIKKKTDFLNFISDIFNLENVNIINGRAEEYIKNNKREYYDVAMSRAVAELRIILEYCVPYLKINGIFLAQKVNYKKELDNALGIIEKLGIKLEKVVDFKLPFSNDARSILIFRKYEMTDIKFPRKNKLIHSKPIK